MPTQIRIAEIVSPTLSIEPVPITLGSGVTQVRAAEILSPSLPITGVPLYLGSGTSQVRIGEIIQREFRPFEELIEISDAEKSHLMARLESLQVLDVSIRHISFSYTEDASVQDINLLVKLYTEILSVQEIIGTQFSKRLQESVSVWDISERVSPLSLTELVEMGEVLGRHLVEFLEVSDEVKSLKRVFVDKMPLLDIIKKGIIYEAEWEEAGESYSTYQTLLSIAFSARWTLEHFVVPLTLVGYVGKGSRRQEVDDIVNSVGAYHPSTPRWQKYADSVEGWSIVFMDKPSWLEGYLLRAVFVDRKRLVLVLLRPLLKPSLLRVDDFRFVKVVVVDLTGASPQVIEYSDVPLFPTARDRFGFFTQGHGLIVGVIGNQALGIMFNEETGNIDWLRFAYITDEFRQTNPPYPSILTVPEGFIFLPNNIFYDLETFHNLPSLTSSAFYLPIYPNRPVVVRRDVSLQASISEGYIWTGIAGKFVRMDVKSEGDIPLAAPSINGVRIGDKWVAWGLEGDDVDEFLLYTYKTAFNPETEKWELQVGRLPYSRFPLPNVGVWSYLPRQDSRWREIVLSLAGNGEVLYFNRLWNRVYRALVSSEEPLKVTHISQWDGLISQFAEKVPENAFISFVAYDQYFGEVYSVIASVPPADPAIVVAKQTLPYSPPPAPLIVFPYNNWTSSRRPYVILQPGVFAYPQEFLIRYIPKKFVSEYNLSVEEAPGIEVFSAADRAGWMVSYDGGSTWQPMTSAVLRTSSSQQILVSYQPSSSLPEGGEYYIIAAAYSRRT